MLSISLHRHNHRVLLTLAFVSPGSTERPFKEHRQMKGTDERVKRTPDSAKTAQQRSIRPTYTHNVHHSNNPGSCCWHSCHHNYITTCQVWLLAARPLARVTYGTESAMPLLGCGPGSSHAGAYIFDTTRFLLGTAWYDIIRGQ